MNDRKAALIARILELLQARKVELRKIAELDTRPRLRLVARDAAFAELAA